MPRTARQVIDGCPHHVLLRGNNRRRLFSYRRDYLYFLKLLLEAKARTGCAVHALCLMANHVHLLVTADDKFALAAFVKHAAQRYAQYRNRLHASSGKLFEQRYRCISMRDEAQLAIATAYIDLNPLRAHLVDAPQDYPWSTFSVHAGFSHETIFGQLWTPTPWYDRLASNSSARVFAYRQWAAAYDDHAESRALAQAHAGVVADPLVRTRHNRLERPDRTRAQ